MTWGMVAVAGATLIGSGVNAAIGSDAASKAADAQVRGADEGAQVQREGMAQQQRQFDTQQANLKPWLDTGKNALSTLYDSLVGGPNGNKFRQSPGYKFAFDEGARAVNANASARGMSMSGNRLKDLTTFGTGVADQDYGNWLARLGQVAGFGTSANNTGAALTGANSAAIGSNANNLADLYGNRAAATASGYVGGANAINSSIGSGINNLTSLYGMTQGGYGTGLKLPGQSSGKQWGWT